MKTDPFVYHVKDAADAFIFHLYRTKDEFLFDEVRVKSISHTVHGVEIQFDYSRGGEWLNALTPYIVPAAEFTASHTGCASRDDWAQSGVIKRLFVDGVRQYNAVDTKAKADLLADLDFLATLK
jgi:hypothetical protein